MIKLILYWYLPCILPTMFLILSLCASIECRKPAPVLGTIQEIKNETTYGNLFVALILGCIPFLNIFCTAVLIVFLVINFFIWLSGSPALSRKPFAKKQWTSLSSHNIDD